MLYVPLHGSFWLASHPDGIHPRKAEFLKDERFVFGNGGVARVVQSTLGERDVAVGDYVCVFGHVPCDHYDCYACNVLHRYTECDYGESHILGHGKGSTEGTYGEVCGFASLFPMTSATARPRKPSREQLMAFMFGFLVADVRNALTRHPDTLRQRRMLLFGAGYSGQIAAYIHNRSCPEAKIFVVDSNSEYLKKIKGDRPN